jgi:hypothetical protein
MSRAGAPYPRDVRRQSVTRSMILQHEEKPVNLTSENNDEEGIAKIRDLLNLLAEAADCPRWAQPLRWLTENNYAEIVLYGDGTDENGHVRIEFTPAAYALGVMGMMQRVEGKDEPQKH